MMIFPELKIRTDKQVVNNSYNQTTSLAYCLVLGRTFVRNTVSSACKMNLKINDVTTMSHIVPMFLQLDTRAER